LIGKADAPHIVVQRDGAIKELPPAAPVVAVPVVVPVPVVTPKPSL
jgi:hypothetical protein